MISRPWPNWPGPARGPRPGWAASRSPRVATEGTAAGNLRCQGLGVAEQGRRLAQTPGRFSGARSRSNSGTPPDTHAPPARTDEAGSYPPGSGPASGAAGQSGPSPAPRCGPPGAIASEESRSGARRAGESSEQPLCWAFSPSPIPTADEMPGQVTLFAAFTLGDTSRRGRCAGVQDLRQVGRDGSALAAMGSARTMSRRGCDLVRSCRRGSVT